MCGIIGFAARSGPPPSLNLQSIRHRGPDGSGEARIGSIALGHTRLSVIDLESGAQPMVDRERGLTIAFNGEIYNYRALRDELSGLGYAFQSRSDTEVVLAAFALWGFEGFSRLRGMFALAIVEHETGRLTLARDQFGIKPLFYRDSTAGLAFASEIGALPGLRENPPPIDVTSVLETLVHRYAAGQHSLYEGVKRLLPGHVLVVEAMKAAPRLLPFYSLVDAIEAWRQEEFDIRPKAIADRVQDSVACHAVADVPVGCLLSGGLDSSIVATELAAVTGRPPDVYTIAFDDAGGERSELPFARLVASRTGARLHEVHVTSADFAELAPLLSGSWNGPFPDPADIAMLKLARRAAGGVKVVQSGEGGDEAFAGYPKYPADRLLSYAPAASLMSAALGRRGRLGIAAYALSERDPVRRWMRWFQNDPVPDALATALGRSGADAQRAERWLRALASCYPSEWSGSQRMQALDLQSWLPNNLLHRGDYTTMQASLEQRVPFLDKELTPWAVALPDRLKFRGMSGKAALRRAFQDKLPPAVTRRRKSGFRLPLAAWLRSPTPLREMTHDLLLGTDARVRAFFDASDVAGLLSDQALSRSGGAKLAWTALHLELWLRSLHQQPAESAIHVDPAPAILKTGGAGEEMEPR